MKFLAGDLVGSLELVRLLRLEALLPDSAARAKETLEPGVTLVGVLTIPRGVSTTLSAWVLAIRELRAMGETTPRLTFITI